jgi:hypothetical protein
MKALIHISLLFISLALSMTAHADMKHIRLSWVQTSDAESSLNQLTLKNEVVQVSIDNIAVARYENPIRLLGHYDAIEKIKTCIKDSQSIGPRGRLSVEFLVTFNESKKIGRIKNNSQVDLQIPNKVECHREMGYSKLISHSFTVARAPSSAKSIKSPQVSAELSGSCKRQGGVLKSVQAIQSRLAKNSLDTYLVSADVVCFFK